jgi:hypothetical protein
MAPLHYNNLMRWKVIVFFIGLLIYSTHSPKVLAADFKTDYVVEYYPQEVGKNIITHVKLQSTITNLRSDLVVKKISLGFPKSFNIDNAKASDGKGIIIPQLVNENNQNVISVELSNPNIGRDSTNIFSLEFDQDKIFEINGNIWEVMVPTIDKESRNSYKVIFHLPKTTDKKISIAKPKPDEIYQDQIIWNNVTNKTIYAVIGDKQYYQLKLGYHLNNPKIVPVYTDIAFPPDTLYQKVYLTSLSIRPQQTMTDQDGNFLARYVLKPKETLDINYEAEVEMNTYPREEVRPMTKLLFENQKNYLLTAEKYWTLNNINEISGLKNTQDIYQYVTGTLKYNYQVLNNKNLKRMGASMALQNPDKAVCMEFSDVFIAIAREKGIYSREIEGFGFSQDQYMRPISLISDILHSWPEYYDTRLSLWVPLDPTWENTSGIDYYSSFDLNHITFAIHGKRSDYPWPAGMYKVEDSKDVIVKAVTDRPPEKIEINIEPPTLSDNYSENKTIVSKLSLINNGNTYLWNLPVEIKTKGLVASPDKIVVPMMAPMEKKEISYQLAIDPSKKSKKALISILVMGNQLYQKEFSIVPYYYPYVMKAFVGLTIIIILLLLLKLLHRRRVTV